ncbi:head GIN domain-containing protein [Psychroserpens sp.]|uniref:head GIN domain-containing protein n=1 Tax=Psychroserpens sp. TaxID=2020870 RepID=UPI003C771ADA
MKTLSRITVIIIISLSQTVLAQTKVKTAPFSKVVISPHIETTFIQGDEESVTILERTEPEDKINIVVKGETLSVYLDDAKETTKTEKMVKNGMKMTVPIYKGKVLTIVVTYKTIEELSLRGEQRTLCESRIDVEDFNLKIYGESQVTLNEVNFTELDVDIYGESQLTIHKGTVKYQKITAFGEAKINLVAIENEVTKLKAYGETEFIINASKDIKFTSYGEAQLHYKGNATVKTGLSFGDSTIERIK